MYVCMFVCMYVCMNVCMYVFIYVCMYVCMFSIACIDHFSQKRRFTDHRSLTSIQTNTNNQREVTNNTNKKEKSAKLTMYSI